MQAVAMARARPEREYMQMLETFTEERKLRHAHTRARRHTRAHTYTRLLMHTPHHDIGRLSIVVASASNSNSNGARTSNTGLHANA